MDGLLQFLSRLFTVPYFSLKDSRDQALYALKVAILVSNEPRGQALGI